MSVARIFPVALAGYRSGDVSETHIAARLDTIAERLESILGALQHNADVLAGQIFEIEDLFRPEGPAAVMGPLASMRCCPRSFSN